MAGLIAAMENADNVEVETNDVAAAQAETAAVQETTEALAEGEELSSEIDNVAVIGDDAGQLEQIGEVAEAAVESGEGLSEDAAAMATIAVERIHNRLFGAGQQRIVPATESFGQTNTRLASTKMVVEGVTETIERIWKAIKAFAARVWDKIKLFFGKLFGSSKMLSKHIENLRGRVRAIPSDFVAKEKTLKNSSLAKAISVKGKASMATFEEVAHNADNLVKFASSVSAGRAAIGQELLVLAADPAKIDEAALKGFTAKNSSFNDTVKSVAVSCFVGAVTVADIVKNSANTKGGQVSAAHGPFVGNVALVVSVGTGDDGDLSLNFSQITAKGNKVAEEADALASADMLKVLDRAEKIADGMQQFQKIEKDAQKITESVEKLSDSIIKSVSSISEKTGSKPETSRAIAAMKRAANDSLALVNTVTSKSPVLMLQTAQAGVNYVSASLANMGPKK